MEVRRKEKKKEERKRDEGGVCGCQVADALVVVFYLIAVAVHIAVDVKGCVTRPLARASFLSSISISTTTIIIKGPPVRRAKWAVPTDPSNPTWPSCPTYPRLESCPREGACYPIFVGF